MNTLERGLTQAYQCVLALAHTARMRGHASECARWVLAAHALREYFSSGQRTPAIRALATQLRAEHDQTLVELSSYVIRATSQ